MKTKIILVLLFILILKPARALIYNGVYADSNNVILPGFTIPLIQVTALTNGYSNFVSQAQFNSASNLLATRAATASLNISNYLGGQFSNILGNVPGNLNDLFLGGSNNTGSLIAPSPNEVMLGGRGNLLVGGANEGSVLIGGISNTLQSLSPQSVILGGTSNYLIIASQSAIVAGYNNRLGYQATIYSTIVGGANNFIVGGNGNVIVGGVSNTVGIYPTPHSYDFVAGVNAHAAHDGCFIWADVGGFTNAFTSTANNQVLFQATGGFGIGTNNPGTNQLRIGGNGVVDIEGTSPTLLIGGTNIYTLFNPLTVSNGLMTIWNYNLTTTSNGLQTQITQNLTGLLATSNQLSTISNVLQSQISAPLPRANQITIAANDTSTTYSFTTPMPDGNYFVVFTPLDANSTSFMPYYDTTTTGHFIAHIIYATNAFDCHYSFLVQEYKP